MRGLSGAAAAAASAGGGGGREGLQSCVLQVVPLSVSTHMRGCLLHFHVPQPSKQRLPQPPQPLDPHGAPRWAARSPSQPRLCWLPALKTSPKAPWPRPQSPGPQSRDGRRQSAPPPPWRPRRPCLWPCRGLAASPGSVQRWVGGRWVAQGVARRGSTDGFHLGCRRSRGRSSGQQAAPGWQRAPCRRRPKPGKEGLPASGGSAPQASGAWIPS